MTDYGDRNHVGGNIMLVTSLKKTENISILKQFDAQLSSRGAKNISIRKYKIKGQPIRHETKISK